MKIKSELSDGAILQELGSRLARLRVDHNLTQSMLAEQAGVSKRTVERLESGEVATQLSGFLRVCRVLGLVDHFESLVPDSVASPMEQLKQLGRKRQRASSKKKQPSEPKKWTWGETP